MTEAEAAAAAVERCGLVGMAGRANVGKSTLVNAMVGQKVTIVSDKPQTTRGPVRAVLTRGRDQAVLVDTPGLHKPRTELGRRLNRSAVTAWDDVDVVVLVLDARSGAGGGDRYVVEQLPRRQFCVLNKVDGMPRAAVLAQLREAGEWGFEEYFPVSARTGRGVAPLVEAVLAVLPPGQHLYPAGTTREAPEDQWVAELVREQLLAVTRDELPYSITCRVTEWHWPYLRCEISVEREPQKAIVIGHGGSVLKRVGTAVRAQLPPGAYLDLSVRVAGEWQRRPELLERMGL